MGSLCSQMVYLYDQHFHNNPTISCWCGVLAAYK
ncbi:hypothetical protein GYH30_034137 [Glycine max]|nr:hypothetical protein GYH30_034137 [Glycine max]